MAALAKINDVAKKYNVTKRSLRYYEEIGLIKTTRIGASRSRYFDEAALNRLEQILLLRSVNFSMNDISLVLLSDSADLSFKIFVNRLNEIDKKMDELNYIKAVISSFIKIGKSLGIGNINIYQLLRDQIYVHKNNERMINMEKSYEGDLIRFELGVGIIPLVDPEKGGKFLDMVKESRKRLESETSKSIPLIRILDNPELNELQYRISVKGKLITDNDLLHVPPEKRLSEMTQRLEGAIKSNISDISAAE